MFPLSELQAVHGGQLEVWTDFHALALRPFGWREVWIGYDPAKYAERRQRRMRGGGTASRAGR